MINKAQIDQLAEDFQIDGFTVFREYLQLIFLSYLYRNKKANKIYFKGGTAIHLLLNSPRFSEDLDFSTDYDSKQIKEILGEIKKEMIKEIPETEILLLYQGKKSIRFRVKYQFSDFKYPLVIRTDFTEKERPRQIDTSVLMTRFPLAFFPIVSHLSPEEILAEKMRAFLTRAKGRDLFDLWFLLEKGVKINPFLAEEKLKASGKKFNKGLFLRKAKNYSLKNLKSDLARFLPESQRKIIPILKEITIEKINRPASFVANLKNTSSFPHR